MRNGIALAFALFSIQAFAKKHTPAAFGSDSAPRGGTFYMNLVSEPEILNPINHSEVVTSQIEEWVDEPLLNTNPDTYAFEPALADKWSVSKDGLTYTFHLREGAKFSDGTPITIDDVRFTFECVKDPRFKAIQKQSYLDNVSRIETPDAHTIRFVMKHKYFETLMALGEFFRIVPKHVYGDPTKNMSKVMIGSGPYKIANYEHGKSIELVRNDNWWGYKTPNAMTKNAGKFDKIVFRFIKEENLQMEMLKKGEIDFMQFVQPEQFVQKAVGEPFGTKIIKHKEINKDPNDKMYGFIGWNNRNPLFKDRDVRIALSELMNRPLMNEKFRFGMSNLAAGPTWLGNDEIADPSVKPLPYDPKKASELLKKAGWADMEKKGILEKVIDGKKTEFRFTLLLANQDAVKYFTMYKEDLMKAGIDMEIKVLEWNIFSKLVREQKFDAITMSWMPGSLEHDLKPIFHSDSAKMGGNNFVGYSNPKVDKLIDEAREEMNPKKRRVLWHKAYKLIAEDAPYTFTFSTKYDLYFVWDHIGMTKGTLKYDRGEFWWWRVAP